MTGESIPEVVSVKHIRDYVLELAFSDGLQGRVDFRPRIEGRAGVFADLHDLNFFRQVRVDPESGTIVWPNEVDFCPSVLHDELVGQSFTVVRS